MPTLIRLQKVLADAGVGSRRECEQLITEGRVDVDREPVTKLGTKVDPDTQTIRVDGEPLKQKRRIYFAVHKPPGVLSTSKDQWRRTRVIDLVSSKDRVFTIGRLDKESAGLILVTNDGEFANQITHPRYQVEKTYQVTVAGTPKPETLQKIRRGVTLSDGRVKPVSITIKKRQKQASILEVVLTEGRNREIRRMLARFDHKVMNLRRVAIGNVRLGDLPAGSHRELTRKEIKDLRELANSTSSGNKNRSRKRKVGAKKRPTGTASRVTTKKKRLGKKGLAKKGLAKKGLGKKGPGKKIARKKTSITTRGKPKTGAVIGGDAPRETSKSKTRRTKPKKS